jgi:hypothetical protein
MERGGSLEKCAAAGANAGPASAEERNSTPLAAIAAADPIAPPVIKKLRRLI